MAIELFSFDNGINVRKKNPLLLKEGEMQSCSGLGFKYDGVLECRAPKNTVNSTALGSIHNIHRYMNWLMVGDGYNIRYKWDLDGYCNQYVPANDEFTVANIITGNQRLNLADYRKFIFMVNGQDRKAFTKGSLYDWGVPNPTSAPGGSDGGSGLIADGDYTLYYTYYVMFPNGHVYETGPSPVSGIVTCTSNPAIIDWTGVMPSTYTGTGVTIWRKLYRVVSSSIYYVDAIKDNTTTTYTDNEETITSNAILSTSDYDKPPDNMIDIAPYLQRIFGIKKEKLYWSEPYIPFGWDVDSNIAVSKKGDDLVALTDWGDQLFMPTQSTWYRLMGSLPATWSIKRTWASQGIINRHTMAKTKWGILGLWYDGICLFDGSASRNITEDIMGKDFFEDITALESGILTQPCYAHFDGRKYYFYYPESGTTLSKCLILDFSTYPPVKIYHEDFIATAHEFHRPTGIRYLGKRDGYQYEETGNETIATFLQSGDKAFGNLIKQKNLSYLFYDLDSGGADVTVTIYADGSSVHTETLNTDSRKRKRVGMPQESGYYFGIGITCADSQDLEIYSPWALETTPFGD